MSAALFVKPQNEAYPSGAVLCVSCCGEQIGVNIPLVDFKSLYDLDMLEWKVRSTKNGFAISFFQDYALGFGRSNK